uniref:UBZ4-type domain-containing protein n=1 Tax=Anopheles atroparvus TaxID=41427 RepID=A0A182IM42_ANOAO
MAESILDSPQPSTSSPKYPCPVCNKWFIATKINEHADQCLNDSICDEPEEVPIVQANSRPESSSTVTASQTNESKRHYSIFERNSSSGGPSKRARCESTDQPRSLTVEQLENEIISLETEEEEEVECTKRNISSQDMHVKRNEPEQRAKSTATSLHTSDTLDSNVPLAERVRPTEIEDYIGQDQIMGRNTILRKLFDNGTIPSMILWGPPGCGKTTLAHIIANHCKKNAGIMRFVKLSATMVGVAEVKEVVKVAKNDAKFKRRTILFMDEIHRFNKAQQDLFLPHVESGTITLIGATTENPSFSLNSALLSRCRVIVLEKHSVESMMRILERALPQYEAIMIKDNNNVNDLPDLSKLPFVPRLLLNEDAVRWLAETCDGDARIGLNGLQLALRAFKLDGTSDEELGPKIISLEDVREGIKKSHLLYDRNGDQHYDIISALHKSIRASDDNAALYWVTRMIASGEDPRFICRRMVRMASEDIGIADTNALQVATTALTAVQSVGMPEADVIIAHCAVYLARAPKSREVYDAYKRCRESIDQWKGPMPSVPLHLRNAPTKLMQDLNYGFGYNLLHKDQSGLTYLPEELEEVDYFSD